MLDLQSEQFVRSLTWDQGIEMARHRAHRPQPTWAHRSTSAIAHSPWQRGSNENTNGLLRQYLPKGTDLNIYSPQHLLAVEDEINNRPRLVLADRTPAQLFATLLASPDPSPLRR